jgi:hypothetical protein
MESQDQPRMGKHRQYVNFWRYSVKRKSLPCQAAEKALFIEVGTFLLGHYFKIQLG